MKFTAEKTAFLAALARCIPITDSKSPQAVLGNVYLEPTATGLKIEATDLVRSISVTCESVSPEPGQPLSLPARDLYDRIRSLPEGVIAFSVEGTRATIKTIGSSRRFTMNGIPGEEFPSIPEASGGEGLETTTHALVKLLNTTHHAVSGDPSRMNLNAMLLESDGAGLRVSGTDGHRVATAVSGAEPSGRRWLIPLAAINDLRKLCDTKTPEPVMLAEHRGTLFANLGGYTFSTKLVDEEQTRFPPLQHVIPSKTTRQVTCDRKALAEAVGAVALSSDSVTGGIRFTFKSGEIVLDAASDTTGDGFDCVPSDYNGEPVTVGFNARYVMDALAVIPTEQVSIATSGEFDPALFLPVGMESVLTLVMPMRA